LAAVVGLCLGAGAAVAAEARGDGEAAEGNGAGVAGVLCDDCDSAFLNCTEACAEDDACISRCENILRICYRHCVHGPLLH